MITNDCLIIQESYKILSSGTYPTNSASGSNGMPVDPLAHDYPVATRPTDKKKRKNNQYMESYPTGMPIA
jgi:hypothetical protein